MSEDILEKNSVRPQEPFYRSMTEEYLTYEDFIKAYPFAPRLSQLTDEQLDELIKHNNAKITEIEAAQKALGLDVK